MSNIGSGNQNSSIDETPAPEWLTKLEDRREKLKRTKLGHEVGAGAPCNDCGDKCPGLDLHFWRKVCRNCKCRKDQHQCTDDDLSGWAQFEILGQIRSKPAYIKIKAIASQPVHLDWVPPNTAPDVISDYMDKLGTTKIPVAGSDAASKRKQQLEFQVPPHDLDAALCDNLTEAETQQLQQYVQKIRESCVGQGNVVRVGNVLHAMLGNIVQSTDNSLRPEYAQIMSFLQEQPVADPILSEIITSDKLSKAIMNEEQYAYPKLFVPFSKPLSERAIEIEANPHLSNPTKAKLCGLNKQAIQSLIDNGKIYDKILNILKDKNLDISRDSILGPMSDFRHDYLHSPQFQQEMQTIYPTNLAIKAAFATPIKANTNDLSFHSPLPLKQSIQARIGTQMMQETPARKLKFANISNIAAECELPANLEYERDPIFAQIITSETLKRAFDLARVGQPTSVVVSHAITSSDFQQFPPLIAQTKQRLQALHLTTPIIQSYIINKPLHDALLQTLESKDIDTQHCQILEPLRQLKQALATNDVLQNELQEFVGKIPTSLEMNIVDTLRDNIKNGLTNSNSNDSGFESKPSTPSTTNAIDATPGRFISIPGVEDMKMWPHIKVSDANALPNALQNLSIIEQTTQPGGGGGAAAAIIQNINCHECHQIIKFGDVAVKAERAGKEIAWHPECFKCHTCNELLADLVYFFHGGQVYCGRDLAIKLRIPRCKACDELIFTKEYTAAESSTFHIKHFCCYQCDTPLAGQKYIPDDITNMPLCLQCYDEYFANACQRCRNPIGPSDKGVAWGEIHWHDVCFLCAGLNCAKSLIGGRFCVKNNLPFCSPACVRSIINA